MNTIHVQPLADHVLCVKLEKKDVERILLSRATTERELPKEGGPFDRRIELVGAESIRFALVLATGPGRVIWETGRRVEPEVRHGDIVLYREAEPRLDLPFKAKECVGGLSLIDGIQNAPTCMMLEALMLGVVS